MDEIAWVEEIEDDLIVLQDESPSYYGISMIFREATGIMEIGAFLDGEGRRVHMRPEETFALNVEQWERLAHLIIGWSIRRRAKEASNG